jgi:hypothetical protein
MSGHQEENKFFLRAEKFFSKNFSSQNFLIKSFLIKFFFSKKIKLKKFLKTFLNAKFFFFKKNFLIKTIFNRCESKKFHFFIKSTKNRFCASFDRTVKNSISVIPQKPPKTPKKRVLQCRPYPMRINPATISIVDRKSVV